ncbi:ornithine carbamoyltransferase mitochondrial precursor [Yamadazyma tenuis ATCC 10573]|uniref:ornithine carbamoyltransferase n=2 Tax=Candida tenuis TaxID=2315449 RepID=G3B1N4_CANTC|nr:ornithine carbamoyltransferase mitochondrial precursor [Yamadazyma tenuis ATCC 10573]EGV64491.1 ornithine carbamoyltransferase mitochondrial precursor [Yamadazyma tenuis ATCC 10573]
MSSVSSSPRHFVNIHQLSADELSALISRAAAFKKQIKTGEPAPWKQYQRLLGKVVALLFSKRSTRTRISTEGAAAYFGASPMFLGKDDIQLGVNESMYDTTKIISSMTSCVFARVGKHQEILDLCKDSSVPIINSLCDKYHPLQAIADMLTIKEAFGNTSGLRLAWVGDSNNVLNDMAIAAIKLGIHVSVAIPSTIKYDPEIQAQTEQLAAENKVTFEIVNDPLVALKNANIIVTDTWISMGEEAEKLEKLKQFANFQINQDMLKKAGVSDNWKFMHCLPRHQEEVHDDVFYSDNSVVFQEGENRLYAALAVMEGFVINKGDLLNAVDEEV